MMNLKYQVKTIEEISIRSCSSSTSRDADVEADVASFTADQVQLLTCLAPLLRCEDREHAPSSCDGEMIEADADVVAECDVTTCCMLERKGPTGWSGTGDLAALRKMENRQKSRVRRKAPGDDWSNKDQRWCTGAAVQFSPVVEEQSPTKLLSDDGERVVDGCYNGGNGRGLKPQWSLAGISEKSGLGLDGGKGSGEEIWQAP
ncbi:hypothetical protein L1887_08877 [Cichorium endivia]|nr:hypothetical protein L1887_08877 [Cichorium endivia]